MTANITPELLDVWKRELRAISISDASLYYFLACNVLVTLLGEPWWRRHVGDSTSRDPFLHKALEGTDASWRCAARVTILGEMLFNFQRVAGIDRRLKELRTVALESAIGELEGARVLFRSGVPFEFVAPVSKLGRDFDLLVTPIHGAPINCDAKTLVGAPGTNAADELTEPSIARALAALVSPTQPSRMVFSTISSSVVSSKTRLRLRKAC